MPATLEALAERVAHSAIEEGVHATPLPRLKLIRIDYPTQSIHAVYEPSLCLVLQGSKRIMLGERVFEYGASQHLIASIDLPIVGQVTHAEPSRPYLCIQLYIEPAVLSDLPVALHRGEGRKCPPAMTGPGLSLGPTTPDMLDAVERLVRLIETPEDISVLGPLYERELLYRVMNTPEGHSTIGRVLAPGRGPEVARAIVWIKENYREPFDMERLAEAARLRSSALHHHFKAVTFMSPLQYQKRLRLNEARRLMLFENHNAASAGFAVGYESPSQFSREYRRQFGEPPIRDIGTALKDPVLA